MIVVIAKDPDFSIAVAEQVTRELARECKAATPEEAKTLKPTLVITDNPMKSSVPVIIAKPPVRLAGLLAEIAQALKVENDAMRLNGGYAFSLERKQITDKAGKTADLTDKEALLLKTLADAGNQGIRREELLKRVWGFDSDMDTHTLETHIYRLRAKLRELSGDDSLIEATDGGYKIGMG